MATARQRKLSFKQTQFVKGLAEGKPKYKAAMEAYDTDDVNVASSIAAENLEKPTIQAAIEAEFARQGITIEKVLKPVVTALDHKDVEIQLKGHDRAVRLLLPRQHDGSGSGVTTNFNFFTVSKEDQDEFDIH